LQRLYDIKGKGNQEEVEGKLMLFDASGNSIEYDVKMVARGKTRRRICTFPPLKVAFSKKDLKGNSIRNKHRKLKLVTHCNGDFADQQNVIKEYLAYKAFNLVTENSFRAHLLQITYKDTGGQLESIDTYAFLIEDQDEVADRLDGKVVDLWGMDAEHFPREVFQTFALFQYMIGNTDWRTAFMHNISLIQSKADTSRLIPVPYDFDYSGLVNAYYAIPNPNLFQENIRQRLCFSKFEDEAEALERIQPFLDHKEAIIGLYANSTLLHKKEKKKSVKYLKSFYKIIEKSAKKLVEESNKNHYRAGAS
ncbi:MAG: hypothetical protein AAFO94_10960, partial [Bacteroidota bacterium]